MEYWVEKRQGRSLWMSKLSKMSRSKLLGALSRIEKLSMDALFPVSRMCSEIAEGLVLISSPASFNSKCSWQRAHS